MYLLGIGAFVFFFLNDYNDFKLRKSYLKISFPVGSILLIISILFFCLRGRGLALENPILFALGIVLGVIGFAGMVVALFFSFDKEEAYGASIDGRRQVFKKKMYALCRHPGVLFFVMMCGGHVIALGMDIWGAAMLCTLNILLILFEDLKVFPQIFEGYEEYREETPFIIPRLRDIRRCLEDYGKNL